MAMAFGIVIRPRARVPGWADWLDALVSFKNMIQVGDTGGLKRVYT